MRPDEKLAPRQRALDLLSRMTLREKVGQLTQRLYGFRVYERHGQEIALVEEFRREEVEADLSVVWGPCTACTGRTPGQERTLPPAWMGRWLPRPAIRSSGMCWSIPA